MKFHTIFIGKTSGIHRCHFHIGRIKNYFISETCMNPQATATIRGQRPADEGEIFITAY